MLLERLEVESVLSALDDAGDLGDAGGDGHRRDDADRPLASVPIFSFRV